MGTSRYMGMRIRGQISTLQNKNDPLIIELDHMRSKLSILQKKYSNNHDPQQSQFQQSQQQDNSLPTSSKNESGRQPNVTATIIKASYNENDTKMLHQDNEND